MKGSHVPDFMDLPTVRNSQVLLHNTIRENSHVHLDCAYPSHAADGMMQSSGASDRADPICLAHMPQLVEVCI